MLKTFKARLIAITAISILSFIILGLFFTKAYYDSKEIAEMENNLITVEKNLIQLRNYQQSFFIQKNMQSANMFEKKYALMMKELNNIALKFKESGIQDEKLTHLRKMVHKYNENFKNLVAIRKKIGLTKYEGLYAGLEESVHRLEALLKKNYQLQLQVDMLMLRRSEKDFLLRMDMQYVDKHDKAFKIFLKDTNKIKPHDLERSIEFANKYQAAFYNIVDGYKKIGLTDNSGARGQVAQTVQQIEKNVKELLTAVNHKLIKKESSIKSQIVLVFIVLFVILLIFTYFVTKKISKQINVITGTIHKITNKQDLSLTIPSEGEDEFAFLATNLNTMFMKLRELISQAKATSSENSSISHELSTTSLSVGNNVNKSVDFINNTVEDIRSMTENIKLAIEEANGSKEEIIEANGMLKDSRDEIIKLTSSVQESSIAESELATSIEALSSDINEVKNVLAIISDIAEQTNLLALNAAIEAARAGEHGRGFAVVADEVRKLAERTQKSLTEINATINIVVQASMNASEQMAINAEQMDGLSVISTDVENKINDTTLIVNNATEATNKTVQDFEKTGEQISIVQERIFEINTTLKDNARSVEEIASASEHLDKLTQELTNNLEQFNT